MFRRMDEPRDVATAGSRSLGRRPPILQAFLKALALLKYGTMYSYIAVCGHMNTVLTGVLTYSIFILH